LDLAKAVVRLLPRHPDLHLVLAGERHSGKSESVDYEAAIQQQFESNGLSNHLHQIGYCDQVPALMKAATLLVHSARQEPFGRVLLEAAACGLPIIATDAGGTSEMLRHQQEAILVSPGDESQLTDAIETALAGPQQNEVHAAAARRRIHQLFSLQSAADRLADFWQKVAEKRRT
jgi:glycosyltransferase involved in cell wall biosynthesis